MKLWFLLVLGFFCLPEAKADSFWPLASQKLPSIEQIKAPNPDMNIHCNWNSKSFVLDFKSKSNDVSNDDMVLILTTTTGKKVKLNIPLAWYHSEQMTAYKVNSLCPNLIVTSSRVPNHVLLWLAKDNRPDFDKLCLILMNIKTGQVLDQKINVAPIKSIESDGQENTTHLTLKKNGNGVAIRLVREVLEQTNDDSAYNDIEDWMEITIQNAHLKNTWHSVK